MKKRDIWFVVLTALFVGYLYGLVKVILFKFGTVDISFLGSQLQRVIENPGQIENRLSMANFTPFKSISQNMNRLSNPHDQLNLFGNIAIFLPFGLFVGGMAKRKFVGVLFCSLGMSLSLECAQIIFSMGSFDVDDLILNTAGGVLGYGIYKIISNK
ncbi:VanZ family protein [Cohnella mopanensis]|uniref:VanZ family protein n=1 Tax=Cohnella mopanensis TaxID=2911966 RepID=UPI001EF98E63|nr:VanZ family protein [Cohnella mopanensis]